MREIRGARAGDAVAARPTAGGTARAARRAASPARRGRNLLNGEELPPKATRVLEPGDVVTVHDARRGRLWSRSMSADPFDGLRIAQSSTAER